MKKLSSKPVTVLVREILGLDKQSVNEAFSEFLTEGRLNPQQIDFVKKIIEYISQNGLLDKKNYREIHLDNMVVLQSCLKRIKMMLEK